MSQLVDIKENKLNISMPDGERVRQISLSLQSVRSLEEKAVVIVVKAWDAKGISVTESCKGVHFSTVLGEMFAYFPETPQNAYSEPVRVEFAEAPTEVSFELLTWPGREPVGDGVFGDSAMFVESYDTATNGGLARNRILKCGGRNFR